MPETDYKINYSAPADRIGRDVDAIIRHLTRLDAAIDKSQAKMKGLGSDTAGLMKFVGVLATVMGNLKNTASAANTAEKELKDVGKGNSSLGSYATRLEKVIADLRAAAAAGAGAQASLAGVGTGGPMGGGGGGGKAGVPGWGRGVVSGLGIGGMAGGVAGVSAAAAILLARKGLQLTGQSIEERREFYGQAAQAAGQFRAGLQEIAAFQGKASADNAVMTDQLAFQAATGYGPEEAAKFRLAYGSAMAPSIGKTISKKTADEFEISAARFGRRYALDPDTAGQLAGMIPRSMKVASAAQGLGILAETAEVMNIYGRSSVQKMANPLLGLQAEMLAAAGEEGGRFEDLPTLAAGYAAATFEFRSPNTAATGMRQVNRLIRSFGIDTPLGRAQEKFLRDLGITPETDFNTAVAKLSTVIKGPAGEMKLKAAGFHNVTDVASAVKYITAAGTTAQARADPRIKAAAGAAAGLNDQFMKSQVGQANAATNAKFAAGIRVGMEGGAWETAKEMAEAAMIEEDTLKAGPLGNIADWARGLTAFGGVEGEKMRIETRAIEALTRGGAAVGIDIPGRFPGLSTYGRTMGLQDTKEMAAEYNRASEAVRQAGGDPFGGAADKLKQGARLIIDGANGLQGQKAGAPIPAPGNQGAGFNPMRRGG